MINIPDGLAPRKVPGREGDLTVEWAENNGEGVDIDYILNRETGEIMRKDPNDGSENNKNDRLYATDENGNETEKSIEVEKNILSDIKSDKDSNGVKYDFMRVNNDEVATNLFEFVADNSLNLDQSLIIFQQDTFQHQD